MRWNIEQLGRDGRWFIRGSERCRSEAEYHARRYKAEDDKQRIRVSRADGREILPEILAPDF